MMHFIVNLFVRFGLIFIVLFLPFVVDLGVVEFSISPYYIKINFSLLISFILLVTLIIYHTIKVVFFFILKQKLKNSKNTQKALFASVINNKFMINKYIDMIAFDTEELLYIKCKNFLNCDDVDHAFELVKSCENLEVKQVILYEILMYYDKVNDFENLGKIIEIINISFHEPCWSIKIQIEFFYKRGELEKIISILKQAKTKEIKFDYNEGEFLAYCYLLLAKKYIDTNKIIEAKQILKIVSIPEMSNLNILFSDILIMVGDCSRAMKILTDLYKTSSSIDVVNLYKSAGGNILDLIKDCNSQIYDYFVALDKYENCEFHDAINYLASNSNNYLVYKLKAMAFLKLDLVNDAKKYMEKLLSSKKIWHWQCKKCKFITDKYHYECINCKKLGTEELISCD